MDVADTIGLRATNGEPTGTIDEKDVLDALTGLTEHDVENGDLYAAAAKQVRHARSAGVEEASAFSGLSLPSKVVKVQLRYRSEMGAIFTDLAIDVGLRHDRKLVPAA